MKLTSPAFKEGESIPSLYTCEGKNISPPLSLEAVPSRAKSLVLIVEDPDVPIRLRSDGMWDHWVVFNIPADLQSIDAGETPPGLLGKTTSGHTRYEGPCPPDREHRYFFKLYALDALLSLPAGSSKKSVLAAMQGHILAEAVLMGRYEKGKGS